MNLKEVRNKSNLTQKELANRVGVSFQVISKYESGTRQPSLETFDKICDVLDLSNKKRMELLKSMSKKE